MTPISNTVTTFAGVYMAGFDVNWRSTVVLISEKIVKQLRKKSG
ncbi:hypothetical protein [Psychrosphaera ytuae]|nr:hypothetical protein [Psychrosphaera ytuae]